DFAYAIHTDVGYRCTGARVNNKMVPLRFTLRHGDIVEIITSAKRKPSKDWLKITKTSRARAKIRQWVKNEERARSITLGKDLLEKELRRLHLNVSQQMKQESLLQIAREFSFQQGEDLLAAIGFGRFPLNKSSTGLPPGRRWKRIRT
ncbi:MAG: bifunctional (p)ppGpp synthetase/guanosine-3',5'-bis(diphosphate) 3'-pyrophosphohydrolase, partial [Desulfobacteraceae bacterium]